MQQLLLNTSNAAMLCGVSTKTWRTWSALGLNPAPVRIGRNLFWRHDELISWIAEGCPRR